MTKFTEVLIYLKVNVACLQFKGAMLLGYRLNKPWFVVPEHAKHNSSPYLKLLGLIQTFVICSQSWYS